MPRPPPPAEALTSTGHPRARNSSASGSTSPSITTDGSVGTPAARMRSFEPIFEPMASMASAGGPTQMSPASDTARANSRRLRQEAVAGVDGVGRRACRRIDQEVGAQIGVGR